MSDNRNISSESLSSDTFSEQPRCRFVSFHGHRCANPLRGSKSGFCPIHERITRSVTESEARAVTNELLAGGAQLDTRESLNLAMSNLFRLVSEKRISCSDGALLAYTASLLLQTVGSTSGLSLEGNDGQEMLGNADPNSNEELGSQPPDHDPSDGYFEYQAANGDSADGGSDPQESPDDSPLSAGVSSA